MKGKIAIIIYLSFFAIPINAHMPPREDTKIMTFSEGKHIIELMIYPAKPGAGEVTNFIVVIWNNETKEPFIGEVKIKLEPVNESSPMPQILLQHGQTSGGPSESTAVMFQDGFYEIQSVFEEEGQYVVDVKIKGDGLGKQIRITLKVFPPSGPNLLFFGLVGAVLLISFVAVAITKGKGKK